MFRKFKSLMIVLIATLLIVPASFAVDNVSDNSNVVDNQSVLLTSNVSLNGTGNFTGNISDNITDNLTGEVDDNLSDSDDDTDDNETEVIEEDEMKVLGNNYGAQMRLLQLQKRVEFQAEAGQIIIDRINGENPDFNTSELESIVEEFNVLIGLIEEYDLNQSQEVVVEDYVAMKKDAIELTNEFRKIAKDAINDNVKAQLREKVENKKKEALNKRVEKIEKLKNKYNLQKVNKLADELGLDIDDYKERVLNGNMTIEEVIGEVKSAYDNLSEEEKNELTSELRKERVKKEIALKEKKKELKEKAEERREELKEKSRERREELIKKAQDRRAEFQKRFEEKSKELKEKAHERQEELREKAEERREELIEKTKESKEELLEDIEEQKEELLEEAKDKLSEEEYEVFKLKLENISINDLDELKRLLENLSNADGRSEVVESEEENVNTTSSTNN